jgi:outer membrane protein TolC
MPIDRRTVLIAGALAFAGAQASTAQEAPAASVFPLAGDPALEALIADALEKSPALQSAREELAAARARVPQADALPDPVIGAGYQHGGAGGFNDDEDSFVSVSVGQLLPFPGKRRLAGETEAKQAESFQPTLERARLDLVEQVRRAYTDLLLARENLELVAEQEQATRDVEAVTRSRYSVGLAEQADVLRAQAELARLARMRLHEQGNEAMALADLNRRLARPAGTPVPTSTRLAALAERKLEAPSLSELLERAERASPERASARLAVERSRLASDLARRMLKPDFELEASYMNRGSLPDMWALNVGIVVPAYAGRKQKQAVAESEARLRSEQARAEAVDLSVRAGIERSLAELAAALRESEAYTSGVLAVDRLAAESSLANYKTGKVPFVAVLEAHNALYRDRWTQAELLAHVLWHSARLDALLPAE